MNIQRKEIRIQGRVQGVGARPFLYRLARQVGLSGYVLNDPAGVTMQIQGPAEAVEGLVAVLRDFERCPERPPLMRIEKLDVEDIGPLATEGEFRIIGSRGGERPVSQVTPDTAVCGAVPEGIMGPAGFSISLSVYQLHALRAAVFDHQDHSL